MISAHSLPKHMRSPSGLPDASQWPDAPHISSVATEEMSYVATEEMSSVATEEISSVPTE